MSDTLPCAYCGGDRGFHLHSCPVFGRQDCKAKVWTRETADESISRAVDWSIPKPIWFVLGFVAGVILTLLSWLLVGPPTN